MPQQATPLPLPLGEVDERSEDGEGIPGCNALSVTFGDSSPKGGAKGLHMLEREMERIFTDMLHHCFTAIQQICAVCLFFFVQWLSALRQRDNGLRQFPGGGQRLVVGIPGGAYLDQQTAGGQILVEPLAAQL